MNLIIRGLIKFYQNTVSTLMPSRCRFYPSCSHYADTAYQRHGVRQGTWLTLKRLSKCHPFHPGGLDEVPDGSY